MIVLRYGRSRPLRPGIRKVGIGTDMSVRKQSHSVLIELGAITVCGRKSPRRNDSRRAKSQGALDELATIDRWQNDWHLEMILLGLPQPLDVFGKSDFRPDGFVV